MSKNRKRDILKAGGIFIICLSAFLVVLFVMYNYYRDIRKSGARTAAESAESRLIEYIDTGMYCTDMMNIICTEYGIRDKEKIDSACEKFMSQSTDVLKMVMIFNGGELEYIYPSDARGVIVPDLVTEGNTLSHEANYSRISGGKIISDTFNLLSGEKVFAIIQFFKENTGIPNDREGNAGHAVVIIDEEELMRKAGVYDIETLGYYYRLYRTNPAGGKTQTLASFGETYMHDPIIVDKKMPNGEQWHLLISLIGGWVNNAEKTAGVMVAVALAFLISFVFYLFISLKGREEELKGLSYSDPLTKIRNSRAYSDSLEELKANRDKYGIIYIDLNDFKRINDSYGHKTGDEILHITAERLANTIRQGDTVYRIGGDEFAVIIHGDHERSFYEGIIKRMKDAMNRKITVSGKSVNVSISCGFARYPEDGTDYQSVIQVADSEMYKDKAIQKNGDLGGSYWLDHDVMTGLFNRDGFHKAVFQYLKENSVSEYLMISTDVRNFKIINQLYGMGKGNEIIVKEARILTQEYGERGAKIARINGDHFAILMDRDLFNEDEFMSLINDFSKHAVGDGYRMIIKVGVYEVTDTDMSPSIMLDKTSMALKSVYNDEETEIVYYTDDMMKDTLIENDVLSRFDNALKNNEFKMYLQPQVDKDGNLLGAEALARWVSDGKVVAPGEFIPILEKTNQIYRLDEVIWEEAAKKLNDWKGTPLENMTISVNISPKDLYYLDIEQSLRELRARYDLTPEKLKLEITETAVMLDRSDGSKLVDKLQEQGFEVEMDDFGSGYSSLNMLKDIKIDVLKIDMGFLNETEDERRASVILDSVITMAKRLGMTVIAEGVESKKQLKFLSDMGCDIFQGFYFSKPVSPESFELVYKDIETV
ncbi:MAG: EAL domain-containing protein [Lachnospiraceae bacterium]|nr:EAL domain-containing protein [Lachnospiraceae bacterium]